MAYAIYKVINLTDTEQGKLVSAIPIYPTIGGDFNIGDTQKFTFVKASTLEIKTPTMLFSASFDYKDKL